MKQKIAFISLVNLGHHDVGILRSVTLGKGLRMTPYIRLLTGSFSFYNRCLAISSEAYVIILSAPALLAEAID